MLIHRVYAVWKDSTPLQMPSKEGWETLVTNLKTEAEIYGCTPYESLIFLVPNKGYVSKSYQDGTVSVDENDTVEESSLVKISVKDKIVEMQESLKIKIWNGIAYNKSALGIPTSDQYRFIFYESCRGLEAWSVLCLDLDVFSKQKRILKTLLITRLIIKIFLNKKMN